MHQKVDRILGHVKSIDKLLPWLIKPQSEEIIKHFINYFKDKKSTVKVYLEIDDEKTVSEIVKATDMLQPNVSRSLRNLEEIGLVESYSKGNYTIYRKNEIDKIIGLSKELEKMINSDLKCRKTMK